ncbi:hypothetical protein [Streptomyces goshikiensis]|uniref:hypothetical protein n=1 Tax=Streptomyces goshikiensis TaxID=1942 RepID=UPI00364BD4DC
MRPARFHEFAATALPSAPEVVDAERWEGCRFGLAITFTSGSRVWIGITGSLAPGTRHDDEELPVEGEAPDPVTWPTLYDDQRATTPQLAAAYLAAALTNSGHPEIREARAYAANARHPGFQVGFHSGAAAFCLITHTARSGQSLGGEYRLQSRF